MNKFDRLSRKVIKETSTYKLNSAGRDLLQQYYSLIHEIEQELISVIHVLNPILKNVKSLKKELAIHIISTINSQQLGTQKFDLMSKLDIITNGGKSQVDPSQFTFNDNDPLLNYLEIIE